MFSELVESDVVKKHSHKSLTFAVSAGFQLGCLLVLLLIPLIYTQALPKPITNALMLGALLPPPKPHPATAVHGTVVKRPTSFWRENKLTQPPRIPTAVLMLSEPELPPEPPSEDGLGKLPGLDLAGMDAGIATVPIPQKPQEQVRPLRQGGDVQAARVISHIQPIYPPLAVQSRIQGDVVLHAIINKDGGVAELQVLAGHPLLVRAALDAVRTWQYRPTLLNGEPVEVDTTITVSFALGR